MRSYFILFTILSLSASATNYNLRTHDTGFYKIPLQQGQLHFDGKAMSRLKLENNKGEHAYYFMGNDLIFFAERLHGEHAFEHPLDDFNGFTLSQANQKVKKSEYRFKNSKGKKLPACKNLNTRNHYEKNKLLIRVATQQYKQSPVLWFWKKLTQLNKKGFSFPLEVSNFANKDNVFIKAGFRSTNIDRSSGDSPHHNLVVKLNGTPIETLSWNGKTYFTSDKIKLPAELIKEEGNTIEFIIPSRKAGKKSIIDIVMVDYFDLFFPIKQNKIKPDNALFSQEECQLELSKGQVAFSPTKNKFAFKRIIVTPDAPTYIGNESELKQAKVETINTIKQDLSKIDYLMIVHPLFIETLKPLADYYQHNGTNVAVVDINHVYQNYSYGVRELSAIKDFIKDIHKQSKGGLKHVLLAGDSSWDWRDAGKNNKYGKWANRILGGERNFTNFPHQKKYTKENINRDFIPTGQYHSPEGHSASDNWFVSITPEKNIRGEDYIPDLAIGRFPASTPEEMQSMVEKTLNYMKNNKVGPWKSRVLWITNADKRFQNSSKATANTIGKYGVMAENIFPKEMDGDNLKVQETLSKSFNSGDLIVHFLGHGGKSIWRIGPPDLKNNRDLFTLKQVDDLQNSSQLPFVMSMSCYSAPFDHPFADSIGEKFIRQPKVGAVAVLAASWRNSPNSTFSRYVMENIFSNPQNSIGQSILEGKRHFKGRTMVEMYNLLGDPALHLAIPSLEMKTSLAQNTVNLDIDTSKFTGKAKIEIVDKTSTVISTKIIDVANPHFSFELSQKEQSCLQGRIYAWDAEQNIDAMASFSCMK